MAHFVSMETNNSCYDKLGYHGNHGHGRYMVSLVTMVIMVS